MPEPQSPPADPPPQQPQPVLPDPSAPPFRRDEPIDPSKEKRG